MQPFPTAFWKKENLILEEDSCFSPFKGSFSQNPTDSVYRMLVAEEPSTPTKAETSDGAIGLYVDIIPQSHLHRRILIDEYGLEEPFGAWRMWWGDLNPYFAIDEASGAYNRFDNWATDILQDNIVAEGVFGPIDVKVEGKFLGVLPVPINLGKTDATALISNAYSIYEVNKGHADYEELVKHFWNRPTCHWPYVKADKDKDNDGTVFLTNEPIYILLFDSSYQYISASEEIKRKGFLSANNTNGMGISSSYGQIDYTGREVDNYPETIKHSWLDSWIRRDDLHRALGPVTCSSSEDCKTITVKCYFEKDAFQAISEHLQNSGHNPNGFFGDNEKFGGDFISHDVLKAIRMGYNGYSDTSTLQQFFYRQRAKARFSFALGSQKAIRITIKGLGTDTVGGGYGGGLNLHIGQDAALKGGTKQDEGESYPKSFTNKESAGTPYPCAPSDSQTCKIFIDNTEKIKCVAPQIGYFEFEDASYPSIGPAESNPIYNETWKGNYLKGPVRIFELASSTINDEGETVNNYKGTGGDKFALDSNLDIVNGTRGGLEADDYHYFHGLEYIDISNFDNRKSYSTNSEIDAGNTTVNPYGNSWKNGDSTNFYDYDSIMVTPTYESPYSFIKDYTLEKGDHTIDLLFDSVRCSMNGGAYYEIQIEIRD